MIRPSSFKMEQLRALKNGQGIKHILNAACEILGNPIALFDTSYNLLANAEGVITDDPLWNELITLGTFTQEAVDFFNQEHFIEAYAQSEVVAMMKSDKLRYDRMNGKLFDQDGVQLGNIVVIACFEPFRQGDEELIEILCEILSIELQNSGFYQKIDRVYQESLLDALIDGDIQDNEIARSRLAELYGELKPNLYLAVIDISKYEHTVTHLAYFRDLFRKIQPEYKYFIHLYNIVVIVNLDSETLSFKRDLGKLNEFFMKHNIYAGVSSAFQDLKDLKERHREAIVALNYGLESTRNQRIFYYDNYRVEHILHSSNNEASILEAQSPIVWSIRQYDRKNGTRLLELLYVYLSYGLDIPAVGEALGMKPEEVQANLKTLEELFEIDWKDGDMLVSLFLSIKLMRD